MRRVIKLPNHYGTEDKFILIEEYSGLGIYQHKTPSGYFTHQHYLISDGNFTVEFPSYSNMCKEEMYDFIDEYNETETMSTKLIKQAAQRYVQHNSGDYLDQIV